MSEDLARKIQQIAQVLNQEELPDNMKELVALLASSLDKKTDKGDASLSGDGSLANNCADSRDGSLTGSLVGDGSFIGDGSSNMNNSKASEETVHDNSNVNSDMINTARKAMSRINSTNDPRINLLQAIKPFMNNKRQGKISNCIQILQLAGLTRLLNDHEK
ncbi:MAG: hypothetical protein GXY17_02465 [Clostridiaceae bacterium]|mgnify:CR=1 FL=1|nr:hypothetical protein [Clostridiaceae bacterium]